MLVVYRVRRASWSTARRSVIPRKIFETMLIICYAAAYLQRRPDMPNPQMPHIPGVGAALLVALLNATLIYKHWKQYTPLFN